MMSRENSIVISDQVNMDQEVAACLVRREIPYM